jgi:hypothetical protein
MLQSGKIYPLAIYMVSFLVYFLPFIIARWRGHPRSVLLGFLDLLLGWTVVAWIVCLVWALCDQCKPAFTRRCPQCTEAVGDQMTRCLFCGNELVYVNTFEKICLMCKARNDAGDTFCAMCCSRLA